MRWRRTKNHGASGKKLDSKTLGNYAREFMHWRAENGGKVRFNDRILDQGKVKINTPGGGIQSLDRMVSEMGAGRMWGGNDYE
jgi:hypothetical protein